MSSDEEPQLDGEEVANQTAMLSSHALQNNLQKDVYGGRISAAEGEIQATWIPADSKEFAQVRIA